MLPGQYPNPRSPTILYNEKGHAAGTARGRQSGLKSRATKLLAIRFGWVVLVIWFEVGEFFSSLSSCKFPDSVLRRSTSSHAFSPPTHVVLLSDPHVPHPRLSYPRGSRPWINMLQQAMEELFMRKSWNVVMRLGRVDVVVVLGDMLDWGRGVMSDSEYEDYHQLFRSIFQLPETIPMYFVPGNHDLPLGPNRLFSPYARERYATHFSPPNALLPVANHTLVLLDSVGLVEEDYRRYAAEMQFGEWDGVEGGVIEFVKSVGEEPLDGPRILLSHIPLARPDLASCGPLREHGRIQKGAGPGYQNLLGSETSRFLLQELQPSIVFSGDDHDYCEYTHPGGIREVTLKSFSSSAGIRRPGFQLLSLIPASDLYAEPPQVTIADRPCFLPDQLGVYTRVYLPLGILTVLFLFFTNVRAAYRRWTAAGHSIYGEVKGRFTPTVQSTEQMSNAHAFPTSARTVYDRPVPLTLPSRRSSQQLAGGSSSTIGPSSTRRVTSHNLTAGYVSPSQMSFTRSAPVSPALSPRASMSEDTCSYLNDSRDEERDMETVTPSLSRRSSYIYMNSAGDVQSQPWQSPYTNQPGPGPSNVSAEPVSYFLAAPGSSGVGLGLSTPTGSYPSTPTSQYMSRGSLSNAQGAGGLTSSPHIVSGRRVTMPRIMSTSDWSAAAKAKDKSVLGLMVDSLPGSMGSTKRDRASLVAALRGFGAWMWRSRNGVWIKSWREVLAVAWPTGLVWVLINALFFLQ